jgi:hypothetical protein
MNMGSTMRGAALMALIGMAMAGCGSKKPPTDADTGSAPATKAVKVEGVHAWLDPDGTKKYDNTAAVVVHNTSDKLATGVTVVAQWPNGYRTEQSNGIAIPAGERGIFLLGPFKPDPPVTGEPKAEVRVDQLKASPGAKGPVKFSGFKLNGKCKVTGTTSNTFKHNHPGTSGLVAGLKDGKIVTAGSIFFEEPGLQPGKDGKFSADLEPLCPTGTPDTWVGYAQLGEQELASP